MSGSAATARPAIAPRQPTPSQTRRPQQDRPADVAERAGERPAGHVPGALRRVGVHQRRLRERDERSACRVAEHEGGEQEPEAPGDRRQRGRGGEGEARRPHERRAAARCRRATPTNGSSALPRKPGIARTSPISAIAQAEVVPDQRPRGRAGATDELVEQLDREQRRDERRSATPGGSGSAANRHDLILAHPAPSVERSGRQATLGGSRMPGKKRPSVKNEKQYEKLKEKGMSKERAAKIANSPGASSRGGKASRLRLVASDTSARRHDRAEEGRRPQGRPRDRAQELTRHTGRGIAFDWQLCYVFRLLRHNASPNNRKGRCHVEGVLAPQSAHSGRTAPSVRPDRPRALCAGRLTGRRERTPAAAAAAGTTARFVRTCASVPKGEMRCFALRRTTGVVAHVAAGVNAARRGQRLRAVRPRQRLQRADDARLGQDRRDRRRLRRPERRERPEHLSQQLRAAGVHDRQRLLQEGQPERRDEPASGGEHRLVVGDHARPRDGLGDLPELPHPARRGEQPDHREPRHRRQHGGRAGRGRRLEQLRRLRVLERDELRQLVLQAPRRRDRRLVRRQRLHARVSGRLAVRDGRRRNRA